MRRKGDDGFAMSSPLALMCGAAVVMAGVAFFTTGDAEEPARAQPVAAVAPPAQVERPATLRPVTRPERTGPAKQAKPEVRRPEVRRDRVYVNVFNNSGITGLASATAGRIGAAGWQVVGSDNWYGTIPATTIYYPTHLQAAARLLAKDLGVARMMPAVDPMSMDRLTVILTADFS